jgi:hypothetical protein
MIAFISEIISRFGGRVAGSKQEKAAQEYTAGILEAYCDKVNLEAFQSHLTAHFESLKIFSVIYWLSLYIFSTHYSQSKAIAAALSIANGIFFLGHFVTYRHWLDFLFPKQSSWNLEGVLEPKGKVKSTLIIAGHIDSVKEFQWWYHLKAAGLALNIIAGFGFVLQGVYFGAAWVASFFGTVEGWALLPYYIFILISPAALSMFFMHGEDVVDGALDNLTGVALAVEMAKVFSVDRLENTRLRLVSFGAEEPALRGSFAYVRTHKERLKEEKAVLINLDTIKEKKNLTIVPGELNTLIWYPKDLVEKMEQSFLETGTGYKKIALPVGATDGSAFAIEGLPAISIIGMDASKYDPCYHTRLDNLDHLEPAGLIAMKEVLIHFIKRWDKEQAQ